MSATVPSRLSGIEDSICSRYSGPSSSRPSVSMLPGITALTVIPRRRQLDRRGPQESELRGLGRAVVRPAREAGDRPGDRGCDDHPAVAAARQRADRRLDGQHRALDVGREDLRRCPARSCRSSRPPGRSRRSRTGRRGRRSAPRVSATIRSASAATPTSARRTPPRRRRALSSATAASPVSVAAGDRHPRAGVQRTSGRSPCRCPWFPR